MPLKKMSILDYGKTLIESGNRGQVVASARKGFKMALLTLATVSCTPDIKQQGDTDSMLQDSSSMDAGSPQTFRLQDCLPQTECPPLYYHLNWEDGGPKSLRCAAELILSQQPGVLISDENHGPDPDGYLQTIFLTGQGTAIVQGQNYKDHEGGQLIGSTFYDPQKCEVEPPFCFEADDCNWTPKQLVNCEDYPLEDCQEVEALLDK